MRLLIVALLSVFFFTLSGQTPAAADQCSVERLHDAGYRDALRVSRDRSAERTDDCAAAFQPAGVAAYQAGYQAGVRQFCSAEAGFRFGLRGYYYRGSCPADLDAQFHAANNDGVEVWRAEHRAQPRSGQSCTSTTMRSDTHGQWTSEVPSCTASTAEAPRALVVAARELRREMTAKWISAGD